MKRLKTAFETSNDLRTIIKSRFETVVKPSRNRYETVMKPS